MLPDKFPAYLCLAVKPAVFYNKYKKHKSSENTKKNSYSKRKYIDRIKWGGGKIKSVKPKKRKKISFFPIFVPQLSDLSVSHMIQRMRHVLVKQDGNMDVSGR